MNFELKPCPFCGNVHLSVLDYESRHRVECPFCGTRTGNYNSEADAIDAWNKRVQPEFEYFELRAIHTVFTSPSPSRRYTDGYNTIVDKCEQALEGEAR